MDTKTKETLEKISILEKALKGKKYQLISEEGEGVRHACILYYPSFHVKTVSESFETPLQTCIAWITNEDLETYWNPDSLEHCVLCGSIVPEVIIAYNDKEYSFVLVKIVKDGETLAETDYKKLYEYLKREQEHKES